MTGGVIRGRDRSGGAGFRPLGLEIVGERWKIGRIWKLVGIRSVEDSGLKKGKEERRIGVWGEKSLEGEGERERKVEILCVD